MILTQLRMAVRHLRKHRSYSMLNLLGLSLGFASVLLIALFVRHELSYDRFHENADRVYRIGKLEPVSSFLGNNRFAVTPAPLEETLETDFPEVAAATQVQAWSTVMRRGDDLSDQNGLAATPGFFDVFSFELLAAASGELLAAPRQIVLSQQLAQKLFGSESPVGAVIATEDGDLTVTGVMADVPATSHIQFDYVVSMASDRWHTRNVERGEWDSSNYVTYVLLRENASVQAFEQKLGGLAQEKLAGLEYYQDNPTHIASYFAQSLTSIHLHSRLNFELGRNGSATVVWLFSAIGALILLLAAFNYINLATARASTRLQEVGIHKAIGASGGQLTGQFLAEAVLLTLVALGVALLVVDMALPWFSDVAGRDLAWRDFGPLAGVTFVVGAVLVGLFSGGYPAIVLASADPRRLIGSRWSSAGSPRLRNALVVAQFAVAVALVAGTMVVDRQMGFVQNASLGVDREHLVMVPMRSDEIRESYETVRSELLRSAAIVDVTASRNNPTNIVSQSGLSGWDGAGEDERIAVYNTPAAPNFTEVLGIDLVDGQSLAAPGAPAGGVLINQEMQRQLGWESAVGRSVNFQGMDLTVVGVMEDFNFLPYRQQLAPLAVFRSTRWVSQFIVRIDGRQTEQALAHMETVVSTYAPDHPFSYRFLDEAYNAMYRSDRRLENLFSVFTLLALAIACLGLVGLASFAAARRTKEISVRKVLGASAASIVGLLTKDLLTLMEISFAIGIPVAYYFASRWLEGFAYRTELGLGVFVAAGIAVLLLGWLSVALQSVRVARTNPAETLRTE